MKSIQTFLESFNCIPFEEKPQILFQTWETFFAIQCSQPEDSNELFQKLLKDLKELAEYDQSTSTDRPIFLNDNEDHPVQNKESPENSSEETEVTPILSTREHENSLSMGYEHHSITPETESDEFTESNAKNLLPIPSECEVTSEDKRECDELVCVNNSDTFFHSKIDDDILVYDDDFEDIKYVEASLLDSEIVSIEEENGVEEENVVQREEEEVDLEDISQVQDVVLRDKLLGITQEVDLFLSDNSIPPGIENIVDDPEGDILFLEELLIDDSILSDESSDANFEDNQLISRPPPEPPDDNFDLEPEVISAVMEDIDEPDEHFNPGGEIFVSTNNKDVDYFPFMFVIRIFLPYLIFPEISPLFLSAESEDTIFDPGLSLGD
nr:hypothetical protein [Tanacetum cinerariifolium]